MNKQWMLFFLILSCQSNKGPEASLHDFINYRFSTGQDRDWLLSNTSGDLNKKIKQMDEQEFAKFIDMGHLLKKRVKINLKDCSEEKCSITYTVKYLDKKSRFIVVIKKIAVLLNIEEKWKVSDVDNIKSHMDSKTEIKIESS